MQNDPARTGLLMTRRTAMTALLASTAVYGIAPLAAQEAAESEPQDGGGTPFSFDWLSARMKDRAANHPAVAEKLPGFTAELSYDEYQRIRFARDRNRWADHTRFQMNAFHPGWLFNEPVHVFEVVDETAQPMVFSTDDFDYSSLKRDIPEHFELPGAAGVRIMAPLNRADKFDELVTFLGASYFRALGRDSIYGLSARGLAVNTGVAEGEEFPRFSELYLQRPAEGEETLTVYAALQSKSVTGAYRFVIHPGAVTTMEVTARLYLRNDIAQLGIAPLTSMYFFGGSDPGNFDDFRPAVHDSEALVVNLPSGETLFRPLNNPPRLASSYVGAQSPVSFGLVQRERDFEQYLDAQAHYERRPSVMVEPLGDWGRGTVRLLEIPSDLEVNDNIVAYWIPEAEMTAGTELEVAYRLRWGMTPPGDGSSQHARILRTRVGKGGVSGVDTPTDRRKFVIDFAGGVLRELPGDADVQANVSITKGEIAETVLSRLDDAQGTWRLVVEARAAPGSTTELKASLDGYGGVLSETWLYQWMLE
ncbi:glucan biosynthesis protein D [Ponticoccus alexandrii]|uniref:Glucans biosynthesis protein G n=2 Tax=Ponticoccus alexandrii TaxID=1943633 RepID=A0ABX7F5V6_9RHOB|nr:glucan biosynthesis protein D [Ponticoccus alexandrii]